MVYAVILAGGKGMNFWPLSTPERPKQLLKLFGGRTLIEQTCERLEPLIPRQRQRVVTVAELEDEVREMAPKLTSDSLYIEPFARNTAPCIGLASMRLIAEDPEAVLVVLPADHVIQDDESYRRAIERAVAFASDEAAIVTIGTRPDRAETSYGYVQLESEPVAEGVHKVKTFAEKPSREIAKAFLESGEFLWNSGIFVFRASRMIEEIADALPTLYAALMEIGEALGAPDEVERITLAYRSIKAISVDYGVMEHSSRAYVVPGDFSWVDVGNWEEVYRLEQKDEDGNALFGRVAAMDVSDSYIANSQDKPVAVIGLDGVVVVQSDEGTLVCPRDRVQDVKGAVQELFGERGRKTERG